MIQYHRGLPTTQVLQHMVTELRITIGIRVPGLVFLPEQQTGYTYFAQLFTIIGQTGFELLIPLIFIGWISRP